MQEEQIKEFFERAKKLLKQSELGKKDLDNFRELNQPLPDRFLIK